MFELDNKTIIITGGCGLIGEEFTKICVNLNANVIIIDIDERKGNKLVNSIKEEKKINNLYFLKADINSIKDINNLIEFTINKFGKIDALINNAYPRNKHYGRIFEDVTYEDFCENVNINLGGYFLITKEISKIMIKQNHGNIINIASIYGFSAPRFKIYQNTEMTMPIEYSAIKGALINMTKYLASYLGKFNIRVNAISPGGVYDNQPEEFVRKYTEKVLLQNRMAKVSDLTGTLVFLLSDQSNYITGQNITIDGGWSL